MELRKASPVVMIVQTIRASLLANATATTLAGLRALSAASQSHNAPLRLAPPARPRWRPTQEAVGYTDCPAWLSSPNFSLPPVEFCLGVAPSQAAKSRPDLKACGSGALARNLRSGERAGRRGRARRQPAGLRCARRVSWRNEVRLRQSEPNACVRQPARQPR